MSDDSKLSSYLFYVEIDGIETARFQKCEGLEAETESFEYEEDGGEVHHFQGRTRYPNLILEKGINDRAKERAIVVHGASYANPSVIKGGERLGRSLGCPALPEKVSRPIIDAIKGGSVMYIYAEKPEYFAQSEILSGGKGIDI